MKVRASMPFWSKRRKKWVVIWHTDTERGNRLFDEKSQALAFVAETNWSKP